MFCTYCFIKGIGVTSYEALGMWPPEFLFGNQFTLELHKVWRWLCVVISPNILQSVTAAAVVRWLLHEYITRHFCATTYFHSRQDLFLPLAPNPGKVTDYRWVFVVTVISWIMFYSWLIQLLDTVYSMCCFTVQFSVEPELASLLLCCLPMCSKAQ